MKDAQDTDAKLWDEIVADIAWLDAHRPSTPITWLLRRQVKQFRELVLWLDELKRAEHRR